VGREKGKGSLTSFMVLGCVRVSERVESEVLMGRMMYMVMNILAAF
jgi:hypothetical protein